MHRLNLILLCTAFLFATNTDEITLLRWAGPPGSRPGTFEEWIAEHPYTEFYYTMDKVYYGDGRLGNIAIFTEDSLAQYLTAEISQLMQHLTNDGYTVYSYNISGGTPETLRTLLLGLYNTLNIEGALFIGDLPVAWFEVYDFGGGLAQFPIDLFYMDLDGIWIDTINTGNDRYDGHIGNKNPEIYIGRLMPTGIGVDTTVLKNYFAKDTDYRNGTLRLPERALVFVDDDWIPYALQWSSDVALVFPDTMSYWHPETTKAGIYRQKLDSAQIWVSVFAHSWPGGHQFVFNNGNQHDYYYSFEYISQNPPTNFYNFFACSFSRYTTNGYGGGQAIFNDAHGIGSIGSTKTGSMLDFQYFYRPLSQDRTLGQAFKYWFDCIYDSVGMNFDRLCWHYGMTLLGDPFLKPTGHSTHVVEHASNAAQISQLVLKSTLISDRIELTLHLNQMQEIGITLFDCSGRFVGELMSGMLEAGTHELAFSIREANRSRLPNGVYVLRAVVGNQVLTTKFIKIN
ncbi:hypothetical protein AMJ83_03600 [candidate division WOR_3 bacterium SM23_42]|uniref:Gingipain domain-containing protein n=1 Tax=candidate division WOR_3 bacterium SM23_42 TaxID=1703779 RepID=A0A0S8FTJ6_UNCW3|nr:MAG: hypothetical protein AMJ83_03600 [candidate division WOR_3 bacterium SM23_42]